jgi:indoleamine 2,3-dioxygenase
MEYAGSYALFNYRLESPREGLEYDNLRLIRAFEHGLDPLSSEAGFVLVHVAMVRQSGPLIAGAMETLDGAAGKDREAFNAGLSKVVFALKKVNEVMHSMSILTLPHNCSPALAMWNKSQPGSYTQFRTFIFGIQSQSMFPDGVIYEGVSEKPLSFRGESGANDSMIPLCDNLLEIVMPHTPLTDILKDFRSYRPGNHREFLAWVNTAAQTYSVRDFALADPHSAGLYVAALDQVRDFRWRHWCFAREYILKMTSHPTATGGSPIVTWLPNQLQAVLGHILAASDKCESKPWVNDILEQARTQQDKLAKEVEKFCKEREVPTATTVTA